MMVFCVSLSHCVFVVNVLTSRELSDFIKITYLAETSAKTSAKALSPDFQSVGNSGTISRFQHLCQVAKFGIKPGRANHHDACIKAGNASVAS